MCARVQRVPQAEGARHAGELHRRQPLVEVEIGLVGDAFIGIECTKTLDDWLVWFRRGQIGEKISVICRVVFTTPTRRIGH